MLETIIISKIFYEIISNLPSIDKKSFLLNYLIFYNHHNFLAIETEGVTVTSQDESQIEGTNQNRLLL